MLNSLPDYISVKVLTLKTNNYLSNMTIRESIIQVMKEDIWTPGSLTSIGIFLAIETKGIKIDHNELRKEIISMHSEGILVKDGSEFVLVKK